MQVRLYEINTGIETSTQPDAGTPSAANDLITKGYADATYTAKTYKQEAPTGVINNANTAFTLSQTPTSNASVLLFKNGLPLIQGTDYTIAGANITMIVVPNFGEKLYAYYVY